MPKPQPRASYRLQLNKDFTFAHVEQIADFLGKLGISHAYLSPILKARAGSTHGYDTVDHTIINPELGSVEDFRRMAGKLKQHGIGIILDIVPNHMGVGGADNPYWLDLLEWGRDSQYATWFDVNWAPSEPSLNNKVLVPFLGCAFGEALETGRLALNFDKAAGSFAAWAEDSHKLPIDPRSYGDILQHGETTLQTLATAIDGMMGSQEAEGLKARLAEADAAELETIVAHFNSAEGREDFAKLIERQNWRAARYSVAADDINYRRFFIVSDLGAIRIEDEAVFDHAHRLIFQLVEEGLVDGLRIDHIDGLYDPKGYALRLREKCPRPIYLVVEKILADDEPLRADWGVDGTTGYEFANAVAQLLTNPEAEAPLTRLYEDFTGRTETLDELERKAKLEIIDYEMAAELDALTVRLCALAKSNRATSDLTRNSIRNGLRHFVASMQVYRSYVDGSELDPLDAKNIEAALDQARVMAPTLDPAVFDFIGKVATGGLVAEGYDRAEALEAAGRLQQYTGPVMAKGLEDTALYQYNRLLALSDVGEKPDRFSAGVEHFHTFNQQRAEQAPLGMLTSSSHDTKRGEDVRAHIAALSLIPDEWEQAVQRWSGMLEAAGIGEIDRNDLYYIFQQIIGAWPAEFAIDIPDKALETFRTRSQAAMMKAVREGRRNSSWTAPVEDYEAKLDTVIATLLDAQGPLFADLRAFADQLGPLALRNSLIAATLKLTSPGMPDIYQGAELYEQSMVDPDNRRPVDFGHREELLSNLAEPEALLANWPTGAAKLSVIHRLLQLRKELPDLFTQGSYEPITVENDPNKRALAFIRKLDNQQVLVVAWLGLADEIGTASLPIDLARWKPVLSDQKSTGTSLSDLLGPLPVAVFRSA
ncbi:malto-oligosyltrehalose synthase [Devosia rhizoryzae]|uniref:Malto-oligosyltrehalose synthase n=1 Tax=Devosia rhizoryzae TaxID=2774137 RepID=A0ABX7C7L6_9HYPH|nr:malto-oligosyltrehalose synthase [Devosia rhizoryzae]QQR40249.1 malto-oligosyltrehalose synthase [Devosia rhizoryzae]